MTCICSRKIHTVHEVELHNCGTYKQSMIEH